jgi:hypothetical protein
MNCLALQDFLEKAGAEPRVQTAITMGQVAEPYIPQRAERHLVKGRIVIFGAGSGMPYFSTDTVAAQRALEIGAEVLLMGKQGTDGVYDSDPRTNPDARKFDDLSYDEYLARDLKVADATAISMARDYALPMVFFSLDTDGTIVRVHQHGAGAKGGTQAIGRSRGGLTTKIVALVDALGPATSAHVALALTGSLAESAEGVWHPYFSDIDVMPLFATRQASDLVSRVRLAYDVPTRPTWVHLNEGARKGVAGLTHDEQHAGDNRKLFSRWLSAAIAMSLRSARSLAPLWSQADHSPVSFEDALTRARERVHETLVELDAPHARLRGDVAVARHVPAPPLAIPAVG